MTIDNDLIKYIKDAKDTLINQGMPREANLVIQLALVQAIDALRRRIEFSFPTPIEAVIAKRKIK